MSIIVSEYQNRDCNFKVCHQRAQILSWQPSGKKDVLWCTGEQFISLDKPIRGGIPLCWPWFAKGENGKMTPSHGFARLADWKLVRDEKKNAGTHHLIYELTDEEVKSTHYSQNFVLTLEYLIGETLLVSLVVSGRENLVAPISFGALHSYFNLGAIERTVIEGLGTQSVDNLDDFRIGVEPDYVKVNGPTEKRFPNETKDSQQVKIHDRANQRIILLTQSGHSDTMLWSPWSATGDSLNDTQSDAYQHFVCVETAAISRPLKNRMSVKIEVL